MTAGALPVALIAWLAVAQYSLGKCLFRHQRCLPILDYQNRSAELAGTSTYKARYVLDGDAAGAPAVLGAVYGNVVGPQPTVEGPIADTRLLASASD